MPGRQAGKGAFCRRNHPWGSFFLQRDAWEAGISLTCYSPDCLLQRNYPEKSSLGELFTAEECISRKEIIPERAFLCRGMHFAEGNHLWESFSLQRDAFRKRKSSLGELFTAEGCISRKEIILGRVFSCRGMHFAEGNHLWESFFLQRDAFRRRKSSLGELFTAEGCISQKEIISGRAFFCRGMLCPTEK